MRWHHLFNRLSSRMVRRTGRVRTPRPRWRFVRPCLEVLEDRLAPAAFVVTNTADSGTGSLRAAIDAANAAGGSNTITFAPAVAGQTITASANDTNHPFAFGPTAFVIAKGDNLTIAGDPALAGITLSGGGIHRLFAVYAGASLTVENLTLTGGMAQGGAGGNVTGVGINGGEGGGGGAGLGGAVFNEGSLNLVATTLTGNTAAGGNGGVGMDGALYGGAGGGSAGFSGGTFVSGGLAGSGGAGIGGAGSPNSGGTGGSGGANEFGMQAPAGTAGTAGGGGGGSSGEGNGASGTALSSGGFGGGGAAAASAAAAEVAAATAAAEQVWAGPSSTCSGRPPSPTVP